MKYSNIWLFYYSCSFSLSSSSPASALSSLLCLFLAHCWHISLAHISPTCDLHQRRGLWGIFHASKWRCRDDVCVWSKVSWRRLRTVVRWGLVAVERVAVRVSPTMVACTSQQKDTFSASKKRKKCKCLFFSFTCNQHF